MFPYRRSLYLTKSTQILGLNAVRQSPPAAEAVLFRTNVPGYRQEKAADLYFYQRLSDSLKSLNIFPIRILIVLKLVLLQITGRRAFHFGFECLRRTGEHQLPALIAALRSQIDHPVARPDQLRIVSTTITVWPASRSRRSSFRKCSTSAGCNPVVGSSIKYS